MEGYHAAAAAASLDRASMEGYPASAASLDGALDGHQSYCDEGTLCNALHSVANTVSFESSPQKEPHEIIHSTVATHSLQGGEVLGIEFANSKGTKAAFFTQSSIGFYDLELQRLISKQKLGQLEAQCAVRAIAVNAELETIAVIVEVEKHSDTDSASVVKKNTDTDSAPVTLIVFLWRTCELTEEEPLKLNVTCDPHMRSSMLPTICVSTSKSPLVILGRTTDGKVLRWQLDCAGSQIESEMMLVKSGGLLAISSSGRWIAVVDHSSPPGVDALKLFIFEGTDASVSPRCLSILHKRPSCIAIIEDAGVASRSCLLALQEVQKPGNAPTPIEVLSAQSNGCVTVVYRLPQMCQQVSLQFCHMASNFLLSRSQEGHGNFINLQRQTSQVVHGDSASSIAISCNQELLATTIGNSFCFHRMSRLLNDGDTLLSSGVRPTSAF